MDIIISSMQNEIRSGIFQSEFRILKCIIVDPMPGVPKKRTGGFSVPCELKVLYIFTSLDKACSAEENDTKIIKFG